MARIDAANGADPSKVVHDGKEYPKAEIHARRRGEWLARLTPDADPLLRLAARAQHIRRWEIPRDQYPMGRRGYHAWRGALAQFHADTSAEILAAVGYGESDIERVKSLILRRRLKTDPGAQLLEDIACLVFLEYDLADFSTTQDEQKMLRIVAKTWRKMSPRGRQVAATLSVPEKTRKLLDLAL